MRLILAAALGLSACHALRGSSAKEETLVDAGAIPPAWSSIERSKPKASDYTFDLVPLADLGHRMVAGSDAQQVPANLQGIWWMDGNPYAPGDVTSFAKMMWDLPGHRVLVAEYGENNYTYNDDDEGRKSYAETIDKNELFEVQFNADYSYARLYQIQDQVRVPVSSIDYTMERLSPNDWVRASAFGGQRVRDYHLRRVFDRNGDPVQPNYDQFKEIAPATFLLPRKVQ